MTISLGLIDEEKSKTKKEMDIKLNAERRFNAGKKLFLTGNAKAIELWIGANDELVYCLIETEIDKLWQSLDRKTFLKVKKHFTGEVGPRLKKKAIKEKNGFIQYVVTKSSLLLSATLTTEGRLEKSKPFLPDLELAAEWGCALARLFLGIHHYESHVDSLVQSQQVNCYDDDDDQDLVVGEKVKQQYGMLINTYFLPLLLHSDTNVTASTRTDVVKNYLGRCYFRNGGLR